MKLFDQLMALCESDTFFFADQVLDSVTYRIFNYRLSSYSEFLKPSALDCRGIMFRLDSVIRFMDGPEYEPTLVCRPMKKFFNLNENPFTMGLDLSEENIANMEFKEDGSLISTFIHNDKLYVKSKGSVQSVQVHAALEILNNNRPLSELLYEFTKNGITVNLEYCSPNNRIVLPYATESLTILNAVVIDTGQHIDLHKLENLSVLTKHLVKKPTHELGYKYLIDNVAGMTGIEGYIVYLKSGEVFKLKCDWYLTQHRCIDTIHSDKRLYEAILAQATDDIKSLFSTNLPVIERILHMEAHVSSRYNSCVATIIEFYNSFKHYERKEFAIKGQQMLGSLFGSAMNLYIGRSTPDDAIKQWMLKNYEENMIGYINPIFNIIQE